MGYRSDGMIWLPDETYNCLPDELKEDLHSNWNKHGEIDDVWTFSYWKWYTSYSDVKKWEEFYYEMEEEHQIDLIVIGEDNAVVFEGTGEKFELISQINIIE